MLVLIMIEALSLQPHSNHLGPYRITKNCTAQYKMCRETKITLVHVGVAVLGDPSNSFGFPLGFRLKLPQQGSPQQRTQTYQCAVWACGSLEFPQNPPGCGWIELPDNASQQTKSLVSPKMGDWSPVRLVGTIWVPCPPQRSTLHCPLRMWAEVFFLWLGLVFY